MPPPRQSRLTEILSRYPTEQLPEEKRGDAWEGSAGVNGEAHEQEQPRRVATAADLVRVNGTIRWLWEKWIPLGSLTIIASEPGRGKTRFCADLARRVYLGLPWPDGSGPTVPAGGTTLWVAADCQHAELATLPADFRFPPEALYLNSWDVNPYGGTMLDSTDDLDEFEARIEMVKPSLVFVDTCLNATDRSSHKPEDTKAFFTPLAQIAQRQQTGLICVTHLNAAGKPLGRRIMGHGRVVMQLEQPDPEGEPNRRRLYVVKSHSLFPAPLGVTMGSEGNEYDDHPPEPKDVEGVSQRVVAKNQQARDWLVTFLKCGGQRVSSIRTAAEVKGISAKALYSAKDALGIEEFLSEGKKWWRFTPQPEQ